MLYNTSCNWANTNFLVLRLLLKEGSIVFSHYFISKAICLVIMISFIDDVNPIRFFWVGLEMTCYLLNGSSFCFRYINESKDKEKRHKHHENQEGIRRQGCLNKTLKTLLITLYNKEQSSTWILTCIEGNTSPTIKFASQLTTPAIATAAGLGPWENSSAVMNHGIGPTDK